MNEALESVRCAHCRQTEAEHYRQLAEFEMHNHVWQPSRRAWLADWHDCPICLGEFPFCCVPAVLRDYVTADEAIMALWFATRAAAVSSA